MARSRRRTISRQSGDAPRFSYATIAKWSLIALGTGGGTYGVFQVANMFPSGAAVVTEGTEVGPHLAEAASAAKPPLPDDMATGFNEGIRPAPIGMASHTNPADNDAASTSMANMPSSIRDPASGGAQDDPPPRPAGLQPGPKIPALPNSLESDKNLDRNLANSLANAANNEAPRPTPTLPDRPAMANPLANGLANGSQPTSPSSLPSTLPPSSPPTNNNPANLNGSGGVDSPPNNSLANGDPVGGPTNSGLPPSGITAPRPINPVANPLSSINPANPAGGLPENSTSASGSNGLPIGTPNPGINPASNPSPPATGMVGINPAPLGQSPLSPNDNNPAITNPNPSPPNSLTPALAASAGPTGAPLPVGNPLPTGPLGSAPPPGANPANSNLGTSGIGGSSAGPSSTGVGSTGFNANPSPPSGLPNTRPTIGIPSANSLAGNPTSSPQPASSTPLASPSTLPRSGSSGLPMADPMSPDPRRTPAMPANYPTQPGGTQPSGIQPSSIVRENPPSNFGSGAGRTPASFVSNRPGDPQWEIQQQASLVIEKLAPPAVQVNVPAKFMMVVRNVGRVPAGQVLIRDRVPEKAQLLQATPKPTRQEGDLMEWELPSLAPGDAFQIQLDLLPTEPGEIGSVAQVTSTAVAATRTRSTRPQLSVQHTAAPTAMVGQTVMMNIIVRNDGDGVAENVILREIVPPQLTHPAGNEIENPIGTLAPGQTRTLQLPLVAKTPGTARNTIRVSGDGKLSSEHSIDIQIVAPQLQVASEGPERRFLSRSATHTFQVTNNGTANATNVQMMARLPQGLRYESSSPEGRYDPSRHAVFWAMANLPSNANQQVALTTMPLAPGNQPIEFHALADLNQPQVTTKTMVVEQLSELFFDIDDLQDPIEVGTNTIYVIRVENQGSQVANDVGIVVDIPAGIEPLNVESPVEYQMQRDGQNSRLVLAPIPNMNPRAQLVIRLEARGGREGDHRIEVRMTSAQRPTPVAKQESTQVYSDR